LRYIIADDGVGIKNTAVQPGTGHSNVVNRLELLFPNRHTFDIAAREPQGTVVNLSFPVTL
jgi:LytS/YehU family sensor histidine kinase